MASTACVWASFSCFVRLRAVGDRRRHALAGVVTNVSLLRRGGPLVRTRPSGSLSSGYTYLGYPDVSDPPPSVFSTSYDGHATACATLGLRPSPPTTYPHAGRQPATTGCFVSAKLLFERCGAPRAAAAPSIGACTFPSRESVPALHARISHFNVDPSAFRSGVAILEMFSVLFATSFLLFILRHRQTT